MFLSILSVLLIIVALAGLVLYPKSERCMSGVAVISVSTVALTCYFAFAVWTSHVLLKRVSLGVLVLFLIMVLVLLAVGFYQKKRIQQLNWSVTEAVGVILPTFCICAVAFYVMTPSLEIRYDSATGAEQFLDVMQLLRGAEAGEVSFQTYIEALFVGVVAPFLTTTQCYNAFAVAEIFMHVLEACMFCALVYSLSEKKIVRYAAPILCIAYLMGYPALSILWSNCDYWTGNAVLFLFGIYIFFSLEKTGKLINRPTTWIGCGVTLALAILWFYQRYFVQLRGVEVGYTKSLTMYRCMYGDLLFFVPALLFVVVSVFAKRQHYVTIAVTSVVVLVETIVLYTLWYNSLLDTYYYFLNYYNLWALGFVLAAVALSIAADTKQLPMYFSYVSMLAVLAILTWTNFDSNMLRHNPYYNEMTATQVFFSAYHQNMVALGTDYAQYEVPEEALEAIAYVIDAEEIEETAILTAEEDLKYWYEAFTGGNSDLYWLEELEFPDVIHNLSVGNVDAVIVVKDGKEYLQYEAYLSQLQILFENDKAVVYTHAGDNWNDMQAMTPEFVGEKQELFSWVKENLSEDVPLMADQSSYMDYVLYENILGKSQDEFYTWNNGAVENIKNLTEHGVSYVTLLKSDNYYQSTAAYFDRFEVVFENETGKIIKCNTSEWPTQY